MEPIKIFNKCIDILAMVRVETVSAAYGYRQMDVLAALGLKGTLRSY